MNLPDITANDKSNQPSTLFRVGMSKVELPVQLATEQGVITTPALCDLYVNLADPEQKGIHMSRLYIEAKAAFEAKELTFSVLGELADVFLNSQEGISTEAEIGIETTYMRRVPSLKSDNTGWRYYPTVFRVIKDEITTSYELMITLTYSSTCPCSAALSRNAAQRQFLTDFENKEITKEMVAAWIESPRGMPATPHSQRSYGIITMLFSTPEVQISHIIDTLENALQTPVQATVKRADEQAFAERNGSNLMFSEDAARRIKTALETIENLEDYTAEMRHEESLHPHDAVAIAIKD